MHAQAYTRKESHEIGLFLAANKRYLGKQNGTRSKSPFSRAFILWIINYTAAKKKPRRSQILRLCWALSPILSLSYFPNWAISTPAALNRYQNEATSVRPLCVCSAFWYFRLFSRSLYFWETLAHCKNKSSPLIPKAAARAKAHFVQLSKVSHIFTWCECT